MQCCAMQKSAHMSAGKIRARSARSSLSSMRGRAFQCVRASLHTEKLKQAGAMDVLPGAAAALAPLLFTLPAAAEEAAETVAAATSAVSDAASDAAATAAAATEQPIVGPAEVFVLLSPILIYGLFNVYREKYNPRATFVDFTLIFASFAVVGNLISIAVYHQRLF